MAKKAELNVKQVEKLIRDAKKEGFAGRKNIGSQLYIDFSNNTQSYLFRFTLNDKQRWYGLGSLNDVTLAVARDKVVENRALVLKGKNPIGHAKEAAAKFKQAVEQDEKKEITFKTCAEEYIALQRPKWSTNKKGQCKTLDSWNSTLENHAYPVIGDMRVHDITIDHIIEVLQKVWYVIPPTAKKLRTRLENILTYAKLRKYRTGENPAAWIGNLKAIFPSIGEIHKEQSLPSMPYQEVPEFVKALYDLGTNPAKALMLTILTGARTNMVRYVRPEHITDGIWEIPDDLMKMDIRHKIDLSPQALEIINSLVPVDGWFFPGQIKDKPFSENAMRDVRDELGRSDITVHGFRSTLRTWITEKTTFRNEVGRKLLAQTLTDNQVDAAYNRANLMDDRKEALKLWGDYCCSEIQGS